MVHAEITCYKGRLVFDLKTKKSIKNEVLTSIDNANINGHIIIDTKNNLGISSEAIALLKSLSKSQSGHVDWSKNEQGQEVFSWKGFPQDIRAPEFLLASKKYKLLSYQVIMNNVPPGAKQAIDKLQELSPVKINSLTQKKKKKFK